MLVLGIKAIVTLWAWIASTSRCNIFLVEDLESCKTGIKDQVSYLIKIFDPACLFKETLESNILDPTLSQTHFKYKKIAS